MINRLISAIYRRLNLYYSSTKLLAHDLNDLYYDLKYSISTREWENLSDYPIILNKDSLADQFSKDFVDYVPSRYSYIFSALDSIPVNPSSTTILDVGSGKGRVLCCALLKGYQKVIGIEIGNHLVDLSRNNLNQIKKGVFRRRVVGDVLLKNINIEDYDHQDEYNVIFMYNPIRGDVLKKFLDKIPTGRKDIWICYLREKADRKLNSSRFHLYKKVHPKIAIYRLNNLTDRT